jgi:hypothetical protein
MPGGGRAAARQAWHARGRNGSAPAGTRGDLVVTGRGAARPGYQAADPFRIKSRKQAGSTWARVG